MSIMLTENAAKEVKRVIDEQIQEQNTLLRVGILAGGCTVGAGLSGVPTLSIAALLTLASIAAGAALAGRALAQRSGAAVAVPAE